MEILGTIVAYLLASPEIIGSAIVWAVGTVFHIVTGTPLTVADAAACVVEGEFVKAGHYVADEFATAVKDKINTGSGIISGALQNVVAGSLTDGIREMADEKIAQIGKGIVDGFTCVEPS